MGLTDERLLLAPPAADEAVVSVALTDVDEVTVQSFDWFLGLLSLGLVAFGLLSIPRNVWAAGLFAIAGVLSLVVTYRKRGRVRIRTPDRAKPLTVHLSDTDAFEEAFRTRVDEYERRLAVEK